MEDESYVSRHRLPLTFIAVLTVAGAVAGPLVFPDLPVWRSAFGGVLIGAFSGLCGVVHQMFE